jgi:hypothetical protein
MEMCEDWRDQISKLTLLFLDQLSTGSSLIEADLMTDTSFFSYLTILQGALVEFILRFML